MIKIKGKVYPNMIHIGDNTRYVTTYRPLSIWTINGTLIFEGRINFYHGTYIYVAKGAILNLGTNGTFVGSGSKIICRERISIGNNVEITWENQIYDTSFHYIIDNKNDIKKLTQPIVIGNNVWIGNRVTIGKGTILPSNSIVSSNSFMNKDFSNFGENCLFAGLPAECKRRNYCRIYDYNIEKEIDKKYNYVRYKL